MNIAFPSKRQVNINFFPCLDAVANGHRLHPDSRFPIPDSRFPIPDSRFPDLLLPALY
ncbi:hypothetical protein [Moorena sp. SIO3H5]|uniref:hypothetical protein n=1 Tax=Moorena sp. SIO3H5 TaxID=2607834 RepID=UPI0013B6DA7D|nr:hypothetical protein [Moorena sp. SIO3H5]NEO71726.1 hypothetical protein [Moorena sp. SIO3H5]